MAAKSPMDEVPRSSRIDQTARIGEDRHIGEPAQPFSSYMEESKNVQNKSKLNLDSTSRIKVPSGFKTLEISLIDL